MHILIVGGTGFIGSHLCNYFSRQMQPSAQLTILTRSAQTRSKQNAINYITSLTTEDGPFDVVINLAGEPLDKNRWNEHIKKNIVQSRIQRTRQLIDYIKNVNVKPQLLISGSAIGFYGNSADALFSEDAEPADHGFTHTLCAEWESIARQAEKYGVRVCLIRTGIVLDGKAGALHNMVLPFKLGLGARLGHGKQWMSWIHIQDVIGAITLLIQRQDLHGAFNLVAPEAVTNNEFTHQLAQTLKRPQFLIMPNFVVRILFGEMAQTLLLEGQHVIPRRLLDAGYVFRFATLKEALRDILK